MSWVTGNGTGTMEQRIAKNQIFQFVRDIHLWSRNGHCGWDARHKLLQLASSIGWLSSALDIGREAWKTAAAHPYQRRQVRCFGHLLKTPLGQLLLEYFWTPHYEETPGQTQHIIEWLTCIRILQGHRCKWMEAEAKLFSLVINIYYCDITVIL